MTPGNWIYRLRQQGIYDTRWGKEEYGSRAGGIYVSIDCIISDRILIAMQIGELPNYKIAVLALWDIGGATNPQHPEDVAAKCYELAPGRFSWTKYPKFPNAETAAVALRDAKKSKNGALTRGNNKSGWLLTANGIRWAQEAQRSLLLVQSGIHTPALRREDYSELNALQSHKLFASWKAQTDNVQIYQVADAVRLTADAPHKVIGWRIDQLLNKAQIAELPELQEYLRWLRTNITKGQ